MSWWPPVWVDGGDVLDCQSRARYWGYCWTCDNAGEFASRLDGHQIEAQLYGWNYAWWKGLTGEVRFDLISHPA